MRVRMFETVLCVVLMCAYFGSKREEDEAESCNCSYYFDFFLFPSNAGDFSVDAFSSSVVCVSFIRSFCRRKGQERAGRDRSRGGRHTGGFLTQAPKGNVRPGLGGHPRQQC